MHSGALVGQVEHIHRCIVAGVDVRGDSEVYAHAVGRVERTGVGFFRKVIAQALRDETNEPAAGSLLLQHDAFDILGRGNLLVRSNRDVANFRKSECWAPVFVRGVIHVEAFSHTRVIDAHRFPATSTALSYGHSLADRPAS